MSEFTTSGTLTIEEVNSQGLTRALESEVGPISVEAQPSTTRSVLSDGGGGGGGLTSGIAAGGASASLLSETVDLASERNALLHEIRDFAERGALGGDGGGGGGGGSLLPVLGITSALGGLSASTLISGTIAAGTLVAGGLAAREIIQGDLTASDIISGTVSAGGLITGTVGLGDRITGDVQSDRLIKGTVGATALISGSIGLASYVSGTLGIGSFITGTLGISAFITGTVSAPALIAGTLAIGAFTAGTIFISDYITGKILASDLVGTETTADEGVYGNDDREKPDAFPITQPGPTGLDPFWDATPPDPGESGAGNTTVNGKTVDEIIEDANETAEENTDISIPTPDIPGDSDGNSSETGSSSSGERTKNDARDQSTTTRVNYSPTFNVDLKTLERKVENDLRKFERRLDRLERELDSITR
jgi:hypothetical protein